MNEEIKLLEEQMRSKVRLDDLLATLYDKRNKLQKSIPVINLAVANEEQNKKNGLLGMLLKKEEKDKESAADRLASAREELVCIEAAIERYEAEVAELGEIEDRYNNALERKRRNLLSKDEETATVIEDLEDRIDAAQKDQKEIREALVTGELSLLFAEAALNNLHNCVGGDGDASNHTMSLFGVNDSCHLDELVLNVDSLASKLSQFRKELNDVSGDDEFMKYVEDVNRCSEEYFGSNRSEWAQPDNIGTSQERMLATKAAIRSTTRKLEQMLHLAIDAADDDKNNLDRVIINA